MMSYKPLFLTGTARSGTSLLCRMLSANNEIMLASDPYLGLFRSLRNAILRRYAEASGRHAVDPSSPFQDYYFTDDRIQMMDLIQAGDLDIPCDQEDWVRSYEDLRERAKLECADLVPELTSLKAVTYKELFDKAVHLIATVRKAENRLWVGFKEVWVIEFISLLARTYPDAMFLVILRDPRGIIASMLAMRQLDATQGANTLSYARHWRKYVAFTVRYQVDDPFLRDRLFVVTHEQLLREPEKTARKLCAFLGVSYDGAMLDTNNYRDYSTGGIWAGNSAFEEVTSGISLHRAERWRTHMEPRALRLVEFVCGPEMRLVGYESVTDADSPDPGPDVLQYMIDNGRQPCSWRSDLGDPQLDYGFELFRRALLSVPEGSLDSQLIRRSFLFEEVFREIRQHLMSVPRI